MALMAQTMVFTYSLSSVSSNKYEFYRGAATSVGAVNGRDKRRAQRAAIDCPAWVRCAVTKAGKTKGACPPILILRTRGVLSRHGSAHAPMSDNCKAESLAIPHIL